MDFYDFNRQFNGGGGGGDDGYDYKVKGVPHMYPAMSQMANMMPSMVPVPVPMMAIRPGAEMDYNRWLSAGGYQQQYRNAFYDSNAYPRQNNNHHEADHANAQERQVFPDDLGDLSPPFSTPNSPRFGPGPPIVTSDRVKGPRGCNLFVFHLPNEITNWDLYLLFRKYGTILSVHTMINKTTGLSKGYGFVSYSAREEALAAITAMDGFRLGKKRLKVQVKRSQDDPMDPEGGGNGDEEDDEGHEGRELEDHQYDGHNFTSGENSAATTRASTPHAQSQGQGQSQGHAPQAQMQAQARAHSDCSSDSLDQEDESQGRNQEHGQASTYSQRPTRDTQPAQYVSQHSAQHPPARSSQSAPGTPRGQAEDAALKMSSLSLTPITPKQAEALHRREAYVVPGATARTPTHASGATATATSTHAYAAHTPHAPHAAHATHGTPSPRNSSSGYGHRADREGYSVQSAPTASGQYEPEIGPRKVTGCIARERIDLLGRICIDLGY